MYVLGGGATVRRMGHYGQSKTVKENVDFHKFREMLIGPTGQPAGVGSPANEQKKKYPGPGGFADGLLVLPL